MLIPCDNPYPAWADEGEEKFANGGHTWVPKKKGSYPLLVNWPQWLGEASNIVALWASGTPRPGADEEVVTAVDQPKTDADQYHCYEHRSHALRHGRPGDLIHGQSRKRDHIPGDRHRVLGEYGAQRRVGRDP